MSKYAELPWSMEDTIKNIKNLKDYMKGTVILKNLDGRGEKDAEEIEFDFGRAIKALEEIQQYRKSGLTPQMANDLIKSEKQAHKDALKNAELVDEYRAIGTPEECRAAVEKQRAKKPIIYKETNRADCPVCGATVRGISKPFGDYCSKCGKKLDWSK